MPPLVQVSSGSSDTTEPEVNLVSCANVCYEKKDGTHGVSYLDSSNQTGWTPVVGKRRKKTSVPQYMLRRFPQHRREELQTISSDSDSSGPDEPLVIPRNSSVDFAVYPGLQIKTRCTNSWTPIAS